DKQTAIAAVEAELGKIKSGAAVHVYDVVADVVANGASLLEVEYFVGGTGWQPAYDLHAAKDLSEVELVYRAKVWQQTREDWDDVDINLSTARPQKGARGPELSPIWLSILQPIAQRSQRELASESALDGVDARKNGAKGRYRGPGDSVQPGAAGDEYLL